MAINFDPIVGAFAEQLKKQNKLKATPDDVFTLVEKLHALGLYTPHDDIIIRSVNSAMRQIEITRYPQTHGWVVQIYRLMQGPRSLVATFPIMHFKGGLPSEEALLVENFLTKHDAEELFSSVVELFKEMSTMSSL